MFQPRSNTFNLKQLSTSVKKFHYQGTGVYSQFNLKNLIRMCCYDFLEMSLYIYNNGI